jgi:BioD-like phosphotransacetylase family protein
MATLIIASSEPRVGRSLIAAAIAYRLGRDGHSVTLVRVEGDEGAAADGATFARLEGIVSTGTPLSVEQAVAVEGNLIVEVPPGDVAFLANKLAAKVLIVGGNSSAPLDVSPDLIQGTVITGLPASAVDAARARDGVLAVLAEDPTLAAPSVADIQRVLQARRIAGDDDATIDRVMIGTVSSDAAAPYFANRLRTCIVTRFDKTDIQLAALQTDLHCLVLTGGGEPSPYLLDRVVGHRQDVALLLAEPGTVESVRAIEGLFGTSRFDGEGKLLRAVELLDASDVSIDIRD